MFGYDVINRPVRPKSKANIRAVSLVEIYYIHKDDLIDILETYPKFARQFSEAFEHSCDLNDLEEVRNLITIRKTHESFILN